MQAGFEDDRAFLEDVLDILTTLIHGGVELERAILIHLDQTPDPFPSGHDSELGRGLRLVGPSE